MEYRPLEITLKSATNLKYVNLISKMDVYAVVSIYGDLFYHPKKKTPVLKDCGSNPRWNNHHLKFTIPETPLEENRLIFKINLVSKRALGDKEIGDIEIPVKELLDNFGNSDEKREKELSYSVRLPKGKGTKGTLSFGYNFGDKYAAPVSTDDLPLMPGYPYPPPPPQAGYGYLPDHAIYGYRPRKPKRNGVGSDDTVFYF